ncbi:hypothetical protein FACS1894188_09200 [Clostridia bacterium]|nr:hypothetical protein FACS1894188_09200 [Clostridia bacterium]
MSFLLTEHYNGTYRVQEVNKNATHRLTLGFIYPNNPLTAQNKWHSTIWYAENFGGGADDWDGFELVCAQNIGSDFNIDDPRASKFTWADEATDDKLYLKYPCAEYLDGGKVYIPLEIACWLMDFKIDYVKLHDGTTGIAIYTADSSLGIKPKISTTETNKPSELAAQDAEVGVLVKWTSEDGAIGYKVYRSENPDEKGELVYEGGASPTEFVDISVKSNTKYYYSVFKLTTPKDGGAAVETPMTFDKGTEGGNTGEVTTGEIRGSECEDKKGYLLMTVDNPQMSANGVITEIDPRRGTAPKNVDGRVLMPIRAAIEAMNGTAAWADAEKKISLTCGENAIEMRLGQRVFSVNGEYKELDVPPQIINDRTMLPIRFVAENIGCEIAWVGATKQVIVVYFQN